MLAHLKDQTSRDPNFVMKPADLHAQHITLVCAVPPVGLRGEIVVALSGVMYRPLNGVHTSLDETVTWPSEYCDRKGKLCKAKCGEVLVLCWDANKLVSCAARLGRRPPIAVDFGFKSARISNVFVSRFHTGSNH